MIFNINNKLLKIYSKPLSKISKKIIKKNISHMYTINIKNHNKSNIINELISFKKEIESTIYKYRLIELNIINKIIYLFFFELKILEREKLIDFLDIGKNDELDETYNLIINYRENKNLNLSLDYDIDNNQKIKNFLILLEKKNIEDETNIFLYLFKNIEYFYNILIFYNYKNIDDILSYILNKISIDYIFELFSLKKEIKKNIENICSICLENEDSQSYNNILTNCNHFYHLNCFLKNYIISYNQHCSICRKIFIKM